MSILNRTIRGIRDSLPGGYVLGRFSSGDGPAQLISMKSLGQALNATGVISGGGGGSSAPAMAFTWYFR